MRPHAHTIVLAVALASGAGQAVETREWTAGPEEMLRGSADGIAVTSLGDLLLAPRTQRLDGALEGSGALEVWSACAGNRGEIFLGTGPDGVVFRTDGNGRGDEFFRTGEAMVTALHRLAGGDLLAATSPGGRIYRIDAEGNGELWSETQERYVWAIAETAAGTVYAATGDRGRILRLRSDGTTQPHFDSDEAHIVSLVHDGGVLLAGGGGTGRVYSVDLDGNAMVLYDDELDEARALVRDDNGDWVVALVGAPPRDTRRPALRLRLPDGTPVGSVEPNVSIEERQGPTLHGFIEGLATDDDAPTTLRGRLIRLDSEGRATLLWESTTETPLSLATDSSGRVVLGTGRPARLYRVEADDVVSLIATLNEAHTTVLVRHDRTLFAGTSNPAAVWRLEAIDAEQGAYLSPAFDAGAAARWGTVSWFPSGRLARTEVYTRTGNSPIPDATWSGWSPALVLADGSPMGSPDGRFAQFRVRFIGTQDSGARLGTVTLAYENYNRPPRVEGLKAGPTAAVSDSAEFSWKASDPDGDGLEVLLEYRTAYSGDWATARAGGTIGSGSGTMEWNTVALPEGLYETRLTVNDRASNDPTEAHRVEGPVRRVQVDRTAPAIDVRELADGRVEIVITDEATRVQRVRLLQDDKLAGRLRASDGVCDSRRERFEFTVPAGAAAWKVRAEDQAGNTTEADLPRAGGGPTP
jgi:hypothetical protein